MAVKSYNPSDVQLIINGSIMTGFADGTFINIGRENPLFSNGSGSSGEGWRAKSSDRTGICTLTLLQTSASNDILSALHALDDASGDGIFALLMKGGGGRSLYSAETAWIEKYADGEFAREVSSREWIIKTDRLEIFVGGH